MIYSSFTTFKDYFKYPIEFIEINNFKGQKYKEKIINIFVLVLVTCIRSSKILYIVLTPYLSSLPKLL
jgi:hypothetical protein